MSFNLRALLEEMIEKESSSDKKATAAVFIDTPRFELCRRESRL